MSDGWTTPLWHDPSSAGAAPSPTSAPLQQQPYNPLMDPTARSWGFDQGLQAGQVAAAPSLAQNENQRQLYGLQGQLSDASFAQQSGYLQQDYQTQLARSGLSQQQLGVQRDALARQPQYLSSLHDLTNQSLNQQAGVARRAVDSSATARGAFTAPGVNQFRTDITDQLANQIGQSDTRYNEQVSSIADQNAMLDLQGKNLGLDRNQFKTELDRGLERLGLTNALSVADLTAKLQSTRIEDQAIAQQIINAAMQSSDYYASQYSPPPSMQGDKIMTGRLQ